MINNGKRSAPEQETKKGFLRRLGALLVVLCAVLAVVALSSMEKGKYLASLRRWLMYGDSRATRDVYTYAADPANRYGLLGNGLLVVGSNAVRIFQDDSTMSYELSPLGMEDPQITVGGRQAAVCDIGGNTLHVLDQNGLLRTMHTDHGLSYYSARLNGSGYLAVTEQKSGYRARVAVYDSGGEMVFHFDSYDSYISDAIVTEDCRRVVAVSLGAQNGAFASRLLVYDMARAELVGDYAIRDGLVLEAASRGDRLITLCDKRLSILTLDGEVLMDQAYGNLYLHDYVLTGKDFCALLLGRYQAGNVRTLTTYNLNGEQIASMELTDEVLDMSGEGEYLAVLYGDSLVIYTKELVEKARLEETGYAGQVRMEADGTALVISGTSARRFQP